MGDADFFGLQALREQLKPKPPGLDDELILNCQGTKLKTTRRVLAKGQDEINQYSNTGILSRMFDPECEEYLTPESDGSFKIDFHPYYIEHMLNILQDESEDNENDIN